MTKQCDFCMEPFKDQERVIAVCPVLYKHIPSKVSFSLSVPSDVEAVYHKQCFEYVLGGGD